MARPLQARAEAPRVLPGSAAAAAHSTHRPTAPVPLLLTLQYFPFGGGGGGDVESGLLYPGQDSLDAALRWGFVKKGKSGRRAWLRPPSSHFSSVLGRRPSGNSPAIAGGSYPQAT